MTWHRIVGDLQLIGDAEAATLETPPAAPQNPKSPSDTAAVCPICRGAGYLVYDVLPGHPDFGKLQPCTCRQEQERQRARQLLAQDIQMMGDCTLERFDTERPLTEAVVWRGNPYTVGEQRRSLRAALAEAHAYGEAASGAWLFFCGPYGSGKSHLAAGIAFALADLGRSVAYASVPEMLDYVRDGIPTHSSLQRLDALKEAGVLVLDDMGTESTNPWVTETLFKLIHHRYLKAQRATIITSNLRLMDLDGRIASRIAGRRFSERVEIPVIAADYRFL